MLYWFKDNAPAVLTQRADEGFASPSHPGEPLSHPTAQLLNSESSWVPLTFLISKRVFGTGKGSQFSLLSKVVIPSSWDPSQRLLSTTAGLEGKRSLSAAPTAPAAENHNEASLLPPCICLPGSAGSWDGWSPTFTWWHRCPDTAPMPTTSHSTKHRRFRSSARCSRMHFPV